MTAADLLKVIPSKLAFGIARVKSLLFRAMLNRKIRVRHQGEALFTMRNYSWMTDKRARTISTKEPETLRWIDGFAPDDLLIDIGANVGIYTLYAACRGHRVLALEPDALNFALLNLNIMDNRFNELVTAYPFSLHRESVIAQLHMHGYNWGGAQKSFSRSVDWKGTAYDAPFSQGSPGIRIDDFIKQTGACPNHLKIDVDGNETLVLEGAPETLANPALKSILVELFSGHDEYDHCVGLIEDAGFRLTERVAWDKLAGSLDAMTENHIYVR